MIKYSSFAGDLRNKLKMNIKDVCQEGISQIDYLNLRN